MITLKIDGKIIYKGQPIDWQERAPQEFRDLIRPGYKPASHMQAILIVMSEAVIKQTDTRITVRTKHNGFSMEVTHAT